MGFLDSAQIDIPCPGCGGKTTKSIGFLTSNNQMDCSSCGETIRLDTSDLKRGIGDADRQLDELKRTIRKIGRQG